MIKKNVILDGTVLSTLMSCGRLSDFKFNHNFQSIEGKSNSIECGLIVHKFLEIYYRHVAQGMKKDMAAGHAFAAAETYIIGCKFCTDFKPSDTELKPSCGHRINDYPGVKNTPKETEGYKMGWHFVLDTCQQYLDYYRNDHWVPIETEVVKAKVLYEDEDIRILWKAKIDLIADTNQGIYSVDHKTMKQRRASNSMSNQFIGQCLVMGTRNVFKNIIGFQTSLKPEEKFVRVGISYSAERLLEWQSQILPYWAKLMVMYDETGQWPANFTHCETKYGNCDFLKVCEANVNDREDTIKQLFVVGESWNPTNEDE